MYVEVGLVWPVPDQRSGQRPQRSVKPKGLKQGALEPKASTLCARAKIFIQPVIISERIT